MEYSDLLLTVAEVAVAFAGFASIVGILGQRSASSPRRLNAFRMRVMLLHSLVVVAFSLVPFLIHSYGVQEETVWRASSGLYVIASMLMVVPLARRLRALRLDGIATGWAGYVAVPVVVLELTLSLGNALGLTQQVAAAVYLTVLALRLFLSGLAFSLLIFSFITPSESDD